MFCSGIVSESFPPQATFQSLPLWFRLLIKMATRSRYFDGRVLARLVDILVWMETVLLLYAENSQTQGILKI